MLWVLMLMVPTPYIANTAGWMTAEIGRQPWIVYGLMRTAGGFSPTVSAGNGLFTLLGFMGMYTLLSILFMFLIVRELEHGPDPDAAAAAARRREEARVVGALWFLIVGGMITGLRRAGRLRSRRRRDSVARGSPPEPSASS